MSDRLPDMQDLARRHWGEVNAPMSSKTELRFGTNGSKSVKLSDCTWYDHETSKGGGYADLHEAVLGIRPADASILAIYDYQDAAGKLVHQVVRKVSKKFVQRRPDGAGGWEWNMRGIDRVPYRLPNLLRASPVATIFICEGEKDCDALRDRMLVATTNAGGAGKWEASFGSYFTGRRVVILPDNDEAGEKHAADVSAKLRAVVASVAICRLPNLPAKGDVSDWLAAGGTAEELEQLAARAAEIKDDLIQFDQPESSVLLLSQTEQEKAQTDPPRWRFFSPTEMDGRALPTRRWIVDQWLPTRTVTIDFGDGGVGKTLLAQQLMTSCATQRPWCGLAVTQCRSIALFCEDDEDELHRRQDAINLAYGIDYSSLSDMTMTSGVGCDNTLVDFDPDGSMRMSPAFLELEKQAKALDAELVVIDTAADTFGGNENVRREVRQFIGHALGRLAASGPAVLLNAHPSRTGLSATGDLDGGSTAWSNTARSRWSLARPKAEADEQPDTDARILTRRKANYASVGDTIKLRWEKGVLVPVAAPYGLVAMAQHQDAETAFLALLVRFSGNGVRVSQSKNASNFAPKVFGRAPDRGGFTRHELDGAMNRLLAAGRIKVHDFGRGGRPERALIIPA